MAARILIVLISALLVWAFYCAARRSVSPPAALAAVVLLVFSAEYIRLERELVNGQWGGLSTDAWNKS